MEGMDTSDIEKDLAEAVLGTWQMVKPLITGEVPTEEAVKAMMFIPDETLRSFGVRLSVARDVEKKIGFDREALKVRAGELKVKEAKEIREEAEFQEELRKEKEGIPELKGQLKEWKANVKYVMDYLKEQGVKGESLLGEMASLFSTGKHRAPLSPELQGQAMTWLARIQGKLADGRLPTESEKETLFQMLDTARINREEELPGLPGGTGLTREEIINYLLDKWKVEPRQAEQIADAIMGMKT